MVYLGDEHEYNVTSPQQRRSGAISMAIFVGLAVIAWWFWG